MKEGGARLPHPAHVVSALLPFLQIYSNLNAEISKRMRKYLLFENIK